MPERFTSLLKRFGLIELKMPGEQGAAALRAFEERTEGFLEVAWRGAWRLDQLPEIVRRYGFDCYSQGVCDGAKIATENAALRAVVAGDAPADLPDLP